MSTLSKRRLQEYNSSLCVHWKDMNCVRFMDSLRYGVHCSRTLRTCVQFCLITVTASWQELIVESDPEYHWADTFRASRTSNDTRQQLFNTLSCQVRRNVGRKALELGGNAVLGYVQYFDLEESNGRVVVRGIGTACTIRSVEKPILAGHTGVAGASRLAAATAPTATGSRSGSVDAGAPVGSAPVQADSTALGTSADGGASTPRGATGAAGSSVLTAAAANAPATPAVGSANAGTGGLMSRARPRWSRDVHLLTLTSLPADIHFQLGGIVSARAIKVQDGKSTREVHDEWWKEVRQEVRSHARTLSCSFVLGYRETASICDNVCILSAFGTAAKLSRMVAGSATHNIVGHLAEEHSLSPLRSAVLFSPTMAPSPLIASQSTEEVKADAQRDSINKGVHRCWGDVCVMDTNCLYKFLLDLLWYVHVCLTGRVRDRATVRPKPPCALCHIPYSKATAPFQMRLIPCALCGKRYVPELLLSTIDPPGPARLAVVGTGQYLEARICRPNPIAKGQDEANAKLVGDALPFLEYHLHRQLVHRLRIMGLNCAFGVRLQVTLGENLLVAVASATAMYCPALPAPPLLQITRDVDASSDSQSGMAEVHRRIVALSTSNSGKSSVNGIASCWHVIGMVS